jgi:hypothetical protein
VRELPGGSRGAAARQQRRADDAGYDDGVNDTDNDGTGVDDYYYRCFDDDGVNVDNGNASGVDDDISMC